MYDLSSKFNTFYTSHVVLSQDEQDNLHNKKNLNIQRLKDGLKEYNIENNTSYTIAETCIQGSVAMSTVVQNEDGYVSRVRPCVQLRLYSPVGGSPIK